MAVRRRGAGIAACTRPDPKNQNDAELYALFGSAGGIGINNQCHGVLQPDTWYRVAVVVQAAVREGGTGQIQKFINGQFVGGQTTFGVGSVSRRALDSVFHLFTDQNHHTSSGYVSSIFLSIG